MQRFETGNWKLETWKEIPCLHEKVVTIFLP